MRRGKGGYPFLAKNVKGGVGVSNTESARVVCSLGGCCIPKTDEWKGRKKGQSPPPSNLAWTHRIGFSRVSRKWFTFPMRTHKPNARSQVQGNLSCPSAGV